MAHRLAGAGLILALLVLDGALGAALAQDEAPEVFTVRDVAVDATAQTAAAAREIALAEGQRRAYGRLMDRLVLGAARGAVPAADAGLVESLIHDFEIADEKTSDVRYLARLTFRFDPTEVRALLRAMSVPFADTLSKPVLVLPVYRFAGALSLWDDPNPWREAWAAAPPRDGLVPLVLPFGELADIAEIGAEQAAAGDSARLAAIAQRYGAADALVAVAARGVDMARNLPTLQVSVTRYGSAADETTSVRQYVAQAADGFDGLLATAVAAVATEVEEQWKRDNRLDYDSEYRLSAVVPIDSLADWVEVRQRLAGVSMVRRSELRGLSRRTARIDLLYIGDEAKLALALAQSDLDLVREGDGWVLRRADRAAGGGDDSAAAAE